MVIPNVPINYIFYGLFLTLFTVDYLHNILHLVPRSFTWLPEMFGLFLCFIIILRIALFKEIKISAQYLILIFCYVLNLLCGIIINSVSSPVIIIGIRDYFLFLPFFIFPLVYEYTDQQIKRQLYFLLILLFFQVPLALYQRLILFRSLNTGDVVTGTFGGPSPLSLMIIAAICILYAFYLRKSIRLKAFLAISFVVFIPAMINETKATMFLLPAGIISASFLEKSKKPFSKIKTIFSTIFIVGLLLTAFVIIYDRFYKDEEKEGMHGILYYMESIYQGKSYLYYGDKAEDETDRKVGRIDAIVLAYKKLSKNIGTLFFGVGMGNTHGTFFSGIGGPEFDVDEYSAGLNVMSSLLWETGILGLSLYILFLFLFLRDTIFLKKSDDLFGILAIGWISIIAIMFINLVYKNTFRMNQINLLFFYFSGIVASKAYKYRDDSERRYDNAENPDSAW